MVQMVDGHGAFGGNGGGTCRSTTVVDGVASDGVAVTPPPQPYGCHDLLVQVLRVPVVLVGKEETKYM